MARLDRLGAAAREVAQIGSAIGREFSYEVLAPIAQKTDMEMQTALSRLQLRDQFPRHDIKVRAIDEAVQRTVLH